ISPDLDHPAAAPAPNTPCRDEVHAMGGPQMHIPDGYLSPATCGALASAMVPAWAVAAKRVRRVVHSRYVPLIAVAAAYSFLVMMLNVPVPDGTSAHAVGAVLIAIVLGPWAAVIAVTIALVIQALFFGDGGVLALGANAFNLAFAMPIVGYAAYRVIAGRSALTSRRRVVAAGIGAYVGINIAALLAAVELGIQPLLFHTANGTPLYSPFHLSQSLPAMALAHLTVAGGVELALTAGVVAYLQRTNLPLLRVNHGRVAELDAARPDARWSLRTLVIGITVLVLATPLGLLAHGTAFGEEAPVGSVWRHALLDGYGFAGGAAPVIGYLVSAVVGVSIAAGAIATSVWAARSATRRRARASV